MFSHQSDTALEIEWKKFWADQGISWDSAPPFPTKRNTIKKFKKLLRQQEEEREYSRDFIERFLSVL